MHFGHNRIRIIRNHILCVHGANSNQCQVNVHGNQSTQLWNSDNWMKFSTTRQSYVDSVVSKFSYHEKLGIPHEFMEKLFLDYDGWDLEKKGEFYRWMATTGYGAKIFEEMVRMRGLGSVLQLRREMRNFRQFEEVKAMDKQITKVFRLWFNSGLLNLKRLDISDQNVIDKVMEYERVHPFDGIKDVLHRIGPGRRIYYFEHPSIPNDPITFIHVALVEKVPERIDEILLEKEPRLTDNSTAVFYSISNRPGLEAVELGHYLIKMVVQDLQQLNMKEFYTYSPIPGFSKWLKHEIQKGTVVLRPSDEAILHTIKNTDPKRLLHTMLTNEEMFKEHMNILEPVMMHQCRLYLSGKFNSKLKRAPDPVSNFHLRNGASIFRLNYASDFKKFQSAYMMVNYHYKLEDIPRNRADYVHHGKIHLDDNFEKV